MFYTKKKRIEDIQRLFYMTQELARAKSDGELRAEDINFLERIVNLMKDEVLNA